MTKSKGRRQREHRLKEVSGAPEPTEAQGEEPEEFLFEEVYFFSLSPKDRVVMRQITGERNQLVDFAIEQQTRVGAEWRTVVRYDCAHEMVHLDRFKQAGGRPKKQKIMDINGIEDVDRGYDMACEAVLEGSKWKENLRRWRDE